MKILMVSMQSLHFFSWTDQLKESGHDVYWFDVLDFEKNVEKLDWTHQIHHWKRKVNYPGRTFLKHNFPSIFKLVNRLNDIPIEKAFEKKLLEIKPDVVHSFAMQLSCIPILNVMKKYPNIKWMYSSWGSDMFYSDYLKIEKAKMTEALQRIDCLITDCQRDCKIAIEKGFTNKFLGVFPGNGGVDFDQFVTDQQRTIILIKGYNLKVARGMQIVKALDEEIIPLMQNYQIIIYGADDRLVNYVNSEERFTHLNLKVFTNKQFITNNELLGYMSKAYLHIGNSASDGLPNSLIEAMGMGAFPIQSNPGNVTTELIEHQKNGLLINDPEDISEIKSHLKFVFDHPKIVEEAQQYNQVFIKERYNRTSLKNTIIQLYD